ncbi:MAG: hypothetical protein V2G51_01705 [bacterium JZ-2024 1]
MMPRGYPACKNVTIRTRGPHTDISSLTLSDGPLLKSLMIPVLQNMVLRGALMARGVSSRSIPADFSIVSADSFRGV